MFIPYILVIDKSGWAVEEKFKKELEDLPKVGEPVQTFYEETFPFYNVSCLRNDHNESVLIIDDKLQVVAEKSVLIIDDKLQVVAESVIIEKIKENVTKLINQAYNTGSEDFLSDARSDSLLKCATDGFKKHYDLDIELYKEDFSPKVYQAVQNELIMYSNASEDSLFINKFLSALNTVMAMNESIPFEGGARFLTYKDEEDKEHLDYSAASRRFADMQDNGYNRRVLKS